jgi:hypothetical protein
LKKDSSFIRIWMETFFFVPPQNCK